MDFAVVSVTRARVLEACQCQVMASLGSLVLCVAREGDFVPLTSREEWLVLLGLPSGIQWKRRSDYDIYQNGALW